MYLQKLPSGKLLHYSSHGFDGMALPREEEIAPTRAEDLESTARLQEDYLAVDAYQTCCTMCTEANVIPAVESVVTGTVPRLSSSMLLHQS